ncbi:hypothetical protein [Salinicola sp. CR57]|uniref:hypothetical protein n=1 Tax=Salinicola sp. CR57 TaxID=1949086 RepID=UPI0013006DE3|nr:hypothetical protein [Salinicola sp. CR57]
MNIVLPFITRVFESLAVMMAIQPPGFFDGGGAIEIDVHACPLLLEIGDHEMFHQGIGVDGSNEIAV